MTQVSRDRAVKDPAAHALTPQGKYVRMGKPLLPGRKERPASACEPPAGVRDGSWHMVQPPKGAPLMIMVWSVGRRDWSPLLPGKGKRLAFTSEYLAAHGWTYSRGITSQDIPS